MLHDRQDFLVEIGTEELPPKSLQRFSRAFSEQLEQSLIKAEFNYEGLQSFITPRRIAVVIQNLNHKQNDKKAVKIGPLLTLAFDSDGKPTPAALGFAKSCNSNVDDLTTVMTPKGESLSFTQEIPGKTIVELAPEFIQQAISALPIPKPMRWGNSDVSFVRPVHWIIMMHGNQVIDGKLFDITADNKTFGHRFHHPDAITISHPNVYQDILKNQGRVIASYEERKENIRDQIINIAKLKGKIIIDEDLLDEVTGLVEWPKALLGTFDQRFLDVPKEALISAMKTHQKYFPIVDEQNDLLPYFVTVANIESSSPEQVIAGNERVVRARLSDAEFFFHTDLKNGIEHYSEQLKTVVFQNKLGTLHDKAIRISHLASYIVEQLQGDTTLAARAGLLCKADLMTEMVGEFPELQGIIGYYYALHNNEFIDIAIAIKEHYLPRFAGDILPTTLLGNACALADRIDTLIGIFGIGQKPTGEKDPFALRRAAIGLLRILIENHLPLNLDELLAKAAKNYAHLSNENVVQETFDFCLERLRTWYTEKGFSSSAFTAVLARKPRSPLDFDYRINAINYFQQLPEAQALAAANKRVSNIFKQVTLPPHTHFNYALLELDAEKQLADIIELEYPKIEELVQTFRYQDALTILARLRDPIDRFFDDVMVMVEDEILRNNRLLLLNNLRELFLQIADISYLQQDHR